MPAISTLRVDNSIKKHHEPLQPSPGPHFYGEEIGGHDQFPMPGQEFLPGRFPTPLRRRLDSVPF
jgi:hypothetical protein